VRIFLEVSKALEAAAQHDMVHRDIKPGNIMISESGEVKVMDFGLAKTMTQPSDVTTAGMVLGTPQYMAPEQGKGEDLDSRADIYSLGCVVYQLLTGTPPFTAETPTAMVYRHIHDTAAPICDLNADIPKKLAEIVQKCLAKSPEDRFESPTELKECIEQYNTGGEPVITPPVPKIEEKPEEDAEKIEEEEPSIPPGKLWIPIAGGIGLLVAVLIFGLVLFRREIFGPEAGKTGTATGPAVTEVTDPGELGYPPCEIPFPGDRLSEFFTERAKGTLIAQDGRKAPIELADRLLCPGKYTLRIEREGFKPYEFEIHLYLREQKNSIEPDLEAGRIKQLEPTRETLNIISTALALYGDGRYLDAEMKFDEITKIAPELCAGRFATIPDAIVACRLGTDEAKVYAGYKAEGQKLLGEAHPALAIKALDRIPKNSAYYLKNEIEGTITSARNRIQMAAMHIVDARKELALGRFEEARASARNAGKLDADLLDVRKILDDAKTAADHRAEAMLARGRNENRKAHSHYVEYLKIAPSDSDVRGIFEKLDGEVQAEIAREKEIEKRMADAKKAMEENRPADAVKEYDYIASNLSPENELVKKMVDLRREAVTANKKLEIENTLAALDRAYQARDSAAILSLLKAEMRIKGKNEVETFMREAAAVKHSKHSVISFNLEEGKESASIVWKFSVLFHGLSETADGSVRMDYSFVNTGEGWKISAISSGDTDARNP
jgi:hypothetical protein